MSPELLEASRQISVITPQPSEFEAYRAFAPEAKVIECNAQLSMPDLESLNAADAPLAAVVNRPGLSVPTVVRTLRQSQRGKSIYIVVITPPEIEYHHEPDLDVDDIFILGNFEQTPKLIECLYARYNRNLGLREQFMEATLTTKNAMDSASEYGSLVHFFESSEGCETIESLAEAIQHFLSNKLLQANFIIDTEHQCLHWPSNGVSNARQGMLKRMSESDKRIVCVGKLLGLNFKHFTLLVSNAPVALPAKYGQLKDTLAHFGAIVESRVKDILIRMRLTQQHDEIIEIMNIIRQSTETSKLQVTNITTHLCQEVELAATTFDMNHQEEEKLLQIANHAADSLYNLHENDQLLESHFLSLIETLSSIQLLSKNSTLALEQNDTIELF